MPLRTIRRIAAVAAALAGLLGAGCGASGSSAGPATHGAGVTGRSPRPLSAEAQSAATGDIPDNQTFLRFRDAAGGYSMLYPEGWARRGPGPYVTFRDKDNLVRVLVARGPAPSLRAVAAELRREGVRDRTLRAGRARTVSLPAGPATKVTYSTLGAPNAVTGKRVELVVDRFVLARGGRVATVDLGTPKGVDNVDAYRMMIRSFRWG